MPKKVSAPPALTRASKDVDEKRVPVLDKRLEVLFFRLSQRVNQLEETSTQLSGRVNQLVGDSAQLSGRVSQLEVVTPSTNSRVTDLEGRIKHLEAQVKVLADNITTLFGVCQR